MRKSVIYLVVGISIVVVAILVVVLITLRKPDIRVEDILAVYQDQAEYGGLTILYPLNETLFPPEIVPPTFRWKDDKSESNTWLVTIKFQDDNGRMNFLTHKPQWSPKAGQWQTIKKRSLEKETEVTVLGVNRSAPEKILTAGRISISTSRDEVDAPLFYREVDLPFVDAVKDPSHIRWRFGAISSRRPSVVLANMPVCGNCHSFSENGKTLAMDVDYANSKGSYVITRVAEEMVLATSDIITWNDYRKEDGEQTFGLLSQVSPDGRFVVSTVKDKSVFVPMPPLAFSQLFFPIKGILCVYDRQTKTFQSLPGADDPEYVQSNPAWSPDGKYIVFARAKAYDLKDTKGMGKVLLTREECREFTEDGKPFLFDLYRIPFNNGKGGKPEPIQGASNNGVSNYFAKYSPDGKWIVFCKAKSYMLLQPDSELYIIPAEGGKPRRLRANTNRMNSWHSWSPNGKWLAFSSKANSPYTQLFLTHIDEKGRSTPAVLLSHFTAPDRAANIPEFVNAKPAAIKKIREQFIDDVSYVRAATEFLKANDFDLAAQKCKKALVLNPKNANAHDSLGLALFGLGKYDEAIRHLSKAVQIEPGNDEAHSHLGSVLVAKGMLPEAVKTLSEALRLDPNNADAHYNFGVAMFRLEKLDEAIRHWAETVRLKPEDTDAHYNLGVVLARQGKLDEAVKHYSMALQIEPDYANAHYNLGVILARRQKHDMAIRHWLEVVRINPNNIGALVNISVSCAKTGQFPKAILYAEKALNLARAAGEDELAQKIKERIKLYKQNKP